MKKIILSLLLLCSVSANAQYVSSQRAEQMRVVDLATQTDSVVLFRVPYGCLITRAVTFIDTTTSNLGTVTVALSEANTTLLTFVSGETDVIGSAHIERPDIVCQGGTVVMRYSDGGDAATGRIRIYIEYLELF